MNERWTTAILLWHAAAGAVALLLFGIDMVQAPRSGRRAGDSALESDVAFATAGNVGLAGAAPRG